MKKETERSEEEFFTTVFECMVRSRLLKDVKDPGTEASEVLHAVGIALQHLDLVVATLSEAVCISMLV